MLQIKKNNSKFNGQAFANRKTPAYCEKMLPICSDRFKKFLIWNNLLLAKNQSSGKNCSGYNKIDFVTKSHPR